MSETKTHWKSQFNYDYLGAYSLPEGKDIILTIDFARKEMITGNNGKKEECLICYFKEDVKPMVINKTNCKTIEKLYHTPYIEDWGGHVIQVGASKVNAFGEQVDALRVRKFPPKLNKPEKEKVVTGSVVWNGIVTALQSGYTLEQAQTKYIFTKEQIKELINIKPNSK